MDDYSQKTYTFTYRQQCKYHSKVLQIMFCFTNWYITLIVTRTLLVMANTAIAKPYPCIVAYRLMVNCYIYVSNTFLSRFGANLRITLLFNSETNCTNVLICNVMSIQSLIMVITKPRIDIHFNVMYTDMIKGML